MFATEEAEPTTLATSVLREDGGFCFSTDNRFRLVNQFDGGSIELLSDDGVLRTPPGLRGIHSIEFWAEDPDAPAWVALRRLYFARPARGWLLNRTCLRGEPIGDAFSCDGRIFFSDGGQGPVADDWLDGHGVVYALRDGGIVAGSSPASVSPFSSHPEEVVSWDGDSDGISTLSSQNVLRLFSSDGGQTAFQPQDAGVGLVFRHGAKTYFSRLSGELNELCAVDASGDAGCEPGHIFAVAGDQAWGLGAVGLDYWYALALRFDGGWDYQPRLEFKAPSGWWPRSDSLRSMQAGFLVVEPEGMRALAYQGLRDGVPDLTLFQLQSPHVASGVRSSVAWVSWDGGTLIVR